MSNWSNEVRYFDREEMAASVEEFLHVYNRRPISSNPGGMGFNHSWAVWFLIRNLRPDFIVESGVLRGHSTWLIDQAASGVPILCFDVSFRLLEYRSPNAEYFEGDLREFHWESRPATSQSLVLLDDHQNTYRRLIDLSFLGFRQFIVEDNYPVGEGDCYSLQHMAAGVGFSSQQMSQQTKSKMKRRQRKKLEQSDAVLRALGLNQNILVAPNLTDWKVLRSRSEVIEAIPPVSLGELNRWGQSHVGNYATPTPLFENSSEIFDDPKYNWITFVRLADS